MEQRPWLRHYDTEVPTTMRYPALTIPDWLQIAANVKPDKPVIDFMGSLITFRQLRRMSIRFANALGEMGIEKGDRVAIQLPNCPQYLIAYYGILTLGGIVVNVNPMYTVAELKHMVELTEPKLLITFDDVLPIVRAVAAETQMPEIMVTKVTDFIDGLPKSTAASLELDEGWTHFSTVLEASLSLRLPRVVPNMDDPAVIIFTGGTTGMPKGAVLTHRNYAANTTTVAAWGWGLVNRIPVEERTVIGVMPFFHVYGQIAIIAWAMYSQGTIIMVPRFEIEEFMNLLASKEAITYFPAVPTMLTAIVNHPRVGEMEIDRKINLINSGAAPMPEELIWRIKDMGIFFGEGWGMTETTSLGMSSPVVGLKKVGSIGIPFIDTDIKLVDVEDGVSEVKKGEPGEILIKSPGVMKEYWRNPEETAETLSGGWLHTGDVAIQDEDDFFFIVDRKKDMIIAGGYNIYPREIDEVLYQHPKIAEAVAVGVPDAYRGETVKAFVVLKEGQQAEDKEIISFCREHLAAYKAPKIIEFRAELPKSAVGKLLRKVLREEELAKGKKG